jgi:hypothetical protein
MTGDLAADGTLAGKAITVPWAIAPFRSAHIGSRRHVSNKALQGAAREYPLFVTSVSFNCGRPAATF